MFLESNVTIILSMFSKFVTKTISYFLYFFLSLSLQDLENQADSLSVSLPIGLVMRKLCLFSLEYFRLANQTLKLINNLQYCNIAVYLIFQVF